MIQPLFHFGRTGGNPVSPLLPGEFVFHSQSAASPIPTAGTLQSWRIRIESAVPALITVTLTVVKNGVASAMTISFPAGTVGGTEGSSGNSVHCNAGDLISVNYTSTGGGALIPFESTMEWVPDDGVSSIHGYATTQSHFFDNAATVYDGAFFGGEFSAVEANQSAFIGSAGTVTSHYVNLNTAPGSGKSRTFVLIINGVVQDGTGGTVDTVVTITDASTSGSKACSLPVAQYDLVSVRQTPAGGPTNTGGAGSIAYTPTIAGQAPFGMDISADNHQGARYAYPSAGAVLTGYSFTESERELIGPPTTTYLAGMGVHLTAAPGLGKSRRFTLRINGVSTSQTVLLSNTDTEIITTGIPERIQMGDRLSLQEIVSGAATNATVKVGWYFSAAPSVFPGWA